MTATDTLRAMLDERGVRYTKAAAAEGVLLVVEISGEQYFILVRDNGAGIEMWSRYFTPEQAIAATLGTGTCEADETETIKCWVKCKDEPSTEHMDFIHVMECTECGHTYEHVNGDYEYCPRCGRKRRDFVE